MRNIISYSILSRCRCCLSFEIDNIKSQKESYFLPRKQWDRQYRTVKTGLLSSRWRYWPCIHPSWFVSQCSEIFSSFRKIYIEQTPLRDVPCSFPQKQRMSIDKIRDSMDLAESSCTPGTGPNFKIEIIGAYLISTYY